MPLFPGWGIPGGGGQAPSSGGGGGGSIWSDILGGLGGWGGVAQLGLGILSSIFNRPKKQQLSPEFQASLAQLNRLLTQGQQPAKADPRELASLLNRVAGIGEGARTRATKSFVGRGLGQSGLFGQTLGDIETDLIPQMQFEAETTARGMAENRQQRSIANQLSALGLIPPSLQQGQSILGAGTQGVAEMLGYLLFMQKILNKG